MAALAFVSELDNRVKTGLNGHRESDAEGKKQKQLLNSVSRDQAITFLDHLGYLNLDDRHDSLKVNNKDYSRAINALRMDLDNSSVFTTPERISESWIIESDLSAPEIALLELITDLDGEFSLQDYALSEIEKDPILIRILCFRLSILPLSNSQVDRSWQTALVSLAELGKLLNVEVPNEIIGLTDDMDHLISLLIQEEDNVKHHLGKKEADRIYYYGGLVRVENKADLDLEKQFENAPDKFKSELLTSLPEKGQDLWKATKRGIRKTSNTSLAHFYTQLMQLRLFMAGTYTGRLDGDMGPVSLEALDHYLQLYFDDEQKRQMQLQHFVLKSKNQKWWIFNLLGLLRHTDKLQEDDKGTEPKALSERLHDMADNIADDEGRRAFCQSLNEQIEKTPVTSQRKRKTRRGRSFLRRIGSFFMRLGEAIVAAAEPIINMIKNAITKLFQLIKNGVRILFLEIRDAIINLRRSIGFVFSRRELVTGPIASDFDFDFDVVTRINTAASQEQIETHQQVLSQIGDAIQGAAAFLQRALPLTLKAAHPLGWIRLAIELASLAARYLFSAIKQTMYQDKLALAVN